MEEWRDIIDYEGLYQVSNLGRVRSLDRVVKHNYGGTAVKKGKVLKPKISHKTRCQVGLCGHNGERWYPLVSRLVYQTFTGPIPEGMQVNHIDENPLNNRVDNLNLMTPKENTNWGTGIERRRKSCSETMKGRYKYSKNPNAKAVVQYDKNGNVIKEFDCLKTAAEYYGITYCAIWRHINGKTKFCVDSIWKYKKAG